jgi:hypothetical protein
MLTIPELVQLLELAISDRGRRAEHIQVFQNHIFGHEDLGFEHPEVEEVLRELAYDLDYYVPDERSRAEDPSYYGDDRVEQEIRSALRKLFEIAPRFRPR